MDPRMTAKPRLLIDNSAWAHLGLAKLNPDRRTEVAAMFARDELVASLPFLLEAGYSARNAADHAQLLRNLHALPRVTLDGEAEERALDAQSQLARTGHHRIPYADLVIAALADRENLGVLHYDHDYDLICERTDLRLKSVWLAEPGAL